MEYVNGLIIPSEKKIQVPSNLCLKGFNILFPTTQDDLQEVRLNYNKWEFRYTGMKIILQEDSFYDYLKVEHDKYYKLYTKKRDGLSNPQMKLSLIQEYCNLLNDCIMPFKNNQVQNMMHRCYYKLRSRIFKMEHGIYGDKVFSNIPSLTTLDNHLMGFKSVKKLMDSNSNKSLDIFKNLCTRLKKNDLIDQSTKAATLNNALKGEKIITQIKWKSSVGDCQHFIDELIKQGIIDVKKGKYKTAENIFIKPDKQPLKVSQTKQVSGKSDEISRIVSDLRDEVNKLS